MRRYSPVFDPDVIRKGMANGLRAACIELQNEAKVLVSVPAPRRLVTSGPRSKNPGIKYYVATTPAIKDAPPRKLSGRGRAAITYEVDENTLEGRVGLNVPYMGRHERPRDGTPGLHKWLSVAAQTIKPKIVALIGRGVSDTVRGTP